MDPQLGSELFRLDLNRAEADRIEPLIREALAPIREVQVLGVERSMKEREGRISLSVSLRIGTDTAVLELSDENREKGGHS